MELLYVMHNISVLSQWPLLLHALNLCLKQTLVKMDLVLMWYLGVLSVPLAVYIGMVLNVV